ncbi:hypothetical protein [Nocardioides sp.]|uniref:hypothetical protein n=1 Tax=Nocardioides sp. TaxID=35761 RepID=UPI00286B55B5|nr:hypothetical protein [Nocardioides sp.]
MKLLSALALLLGGAAVGLASVALHPLWWGLLLGVVATSAALWALPPGWWLRAAFGAGWAAMAAYLSVPRPEGDYVISADAQGYALLGFGVAVLIFSLATLPAPTFRAGGRLRK